MSRRSVCVGRCGFWLGVVSTVLAIASPSLAQSPGEADAGVPDAASGPADTAGVQAPADSGDLDAGVAEQPPTDEGQQAPSGEPVPSATATGAPAAPDAGPSDQAGPASPPPEQEGPARIEELSLQDLLNVQSVTAGVNQERVLAPANVIVITRDEIAQHGWRTLADILAHVPGLYVTDDFVLPSVGVRGTSGGLRGGTRIIRVMIDGVPVNFRPDLTAFIGPEFIPMEAIERVEIAKGPLSALWGSNAFLATVNVITKNAEQGAHAEVAGHLQLVRESRLGYGASALVSRATDHTQLMLGIVTDRADRSGLYVRKTFDAQNFSNIFDPNHPERSLSSSGCGTAADRAAGCTGLSDVAARLGGYGKLRLTSDRLGSLSLQGGIQQVDALGEFQVASVLTHRSRIALRNYWGDLNYDLHTSDHLELLASVGYSSGGPTRDMVLFQTDVANTWFRPQFDYKAFNGDMAAVYTPLDDPNALAFRLGADAEVDNETVLFYKRQQIIGLNEMDTDLIAVGRDRGDVLQDYGVHLQVNGTPIPSIRDFQLTGNVRVDAINYGSGDVSFQPPPQFSWRLAAVYRPSEHFTAKLFGGSAFQSPSGVLLFARTGLGTRDNIIGALTIPGGTLKPQSVNSAEVDLIASNDHLTVEADAYYNRVTDTISFQSTAGNFQARNGGTSDGLGGELSVRTQFDWFGAYGNVSAYLHKDEGKSSFTFDPPPLYPNIFGAVGVDLRIPQAHVRADLSVKAVGERGASDANVLDNSHKFYTLAPYSTVDLTVATFGFHPLGDDDETRITVGVRNLLNQSYNEPYFGGIDLPNLGRLFFVELRQLYGGTQ